MAFWLTFGQKMAENGVEIQGGASFVANQFNQMGFNDVGLDTKGRLTLQVSDLKTKQHLVKSEYLINLGKKRLKINIEISANCYCVLSLW